MKNKNNNNIMIPYVGTIVSLSICVIATFIKYMKYSSWFYTKKFSVYDLFLESIKDPKTMLGTTEDIFIFILIILGIVFLVFFLAGTDGKGWLHYIGLALALIFSIWYKIVCKQSKKKAEIANN